VIAETAGWEWIFFLNVPAGRFIDRAGEELWPDGTLAARYRFAHDLHRADAVASRERPRFERVYAARKLSRAGDPKKGRESGSSL
jgi:hypothetical protein